MARVFPTLLILLQVCAGIGYVTAGDWRRVIYWFSAAILTAAVTW